MPADPATLAALLDRVRGAETPYSPLFYDLGEYLVDDIEWRITWHKLLYARAWTDAALALAERVLPGWRRSVGNMPNDTGRPACACLASPEALAGVGPTAFEGGETEALALLAATLSALLAQAETEAADAL